MKDIMCMVCIALTSCATSVTTTIQGVKAECREPGAEVITIVENIGGEESVKMKCTWDIPLEQF